MVRVTFRVFGKDGHRQLSDTCLELHVEKEYKCIIRQQLIDMKKNLIDIINLEKQAENAIKE